MKKFSAVPFLAAVAMLCSCSLRQPAVMTQDYALKVPAPAAGLARTRPISVLPVTAAPGASGQMFFYRADDLRYERDFYNRLIAPPAQLLTGELRTWITKSKVGTVCEPGSPLAPDWIVEPRLTEFYADYRDPQRPRAVVSMVIALIARNDSGNRQIFERTYRGEVPMREISPSAAAEGWGRASGQLFAAFTRDLRQVAP